MADIVTMPKLGLTMKDGTVAKWCKKEGEKISEGDVLLEIATDKLTNSVESDYEGFVRKILVEEGERVPCQTPLCIIGAEDEDISGCIAEAEDM